LSLLKKDKSDIPKTFTANYYDAEYFVGGEGGKAFCRPNGTVKKWAYFNPTGEFLGARSITEAWKTVFKPLNMLSIGEGRGTFIAYARDAGIEAFSFDYSTWAVGEGRYKRCKPEWLILHDATKQWPYPDNSFDLVVALDFYEHIYEDDLEFVINEMYRVSKKWIFLLIATVDGVREKGYLLDKEKTVPVELEGYAVAAHVTVRTEKWWIEKFEEVNSDWWTRVDMVNWFAGLVKPEIIRNWLLNSIIILEYVG